MEVGYLVGMCIIVDVFDVIIMLYNVKQQFLNVCYNYLINELNIKLVLGILNEQDLVVLNNMLGKFIFIFVDSVVLENL